MPKKTHHQLIAGEVFFTKDGEHHAPHINGVLQTETRNITARDIGRAQQTLQMNLHRQAEDPEVQIYNVFIFSISYLGHMTQREFEKRPEGSVLQELPADPADQVFN